MKRIILLVVLAILIIGLGWKLYENINRPIKFKTEYEARKKAVVDRLKEIRALQQAYKSARGQYTASFDTLVNFYNTGQMQTLISYGSLDDSITAANTKAYEKLYDEQQKLIKARRPVKGEVLAALVDLPEAEIFKRGLAVRKPVFDAVKAVVKVDTVLLSRKPDFKIEELRYVPGVSPAANGNRPEFEMEAKFKEVSKIQIPLFEARVTNDVFLSGLDKQEIVNLSDEQKNKLVNNYPGLKVGDINNPNNDAGNWE